jgi:hypothetical protein
MSKVENEAEPKLTEIKEGLYVFKSLTRNPQDVKEQLIKELEEQAEKLHRE